LDGTGRDVSGPASECPEEETECDESSVSCAELIQRFLLRGWSADDGSECFWPFGSESGSECDVVDAAVHAGGASGRQGRLRPRSQCWRTMSLRVESRALSAAFAMSRAVCAARARATAPQRSSERKVRRLVGVRRCGSDTRQRLSVRLNGCLIADLSAQ